MLFRHLASFLIMVFVVGVSSAQNNNKLDSIFVKNSNLVYQDPEQVIKVSSYLTDISKTKKERAEGLYLSSESNFIKGNYNNSIEDLYEANQLIKDTDFTSLKVFVLTSIATRCRLFGMYDKSNDYIEQALTLLKNIDSGDEKVMCEAKILYEQSYLDIQSKKYEQALEKLNSSSNTLKSIQNVYPILAARIQVATGDVESILLHFDKAKAHYDATLGILGKNHLENSTVASKAFNGKGSVALAEKNYPEAETLLNKAQSFLLIDSYTKPIIYKNLSDLYTVLNDIEKQNLYYQKYKTLTDEILDGERQSRNTIIKQIEKEEAYSTAKEKSSYNYIIILLAGILILACLIYFFYNRKLNREYKHFEAILEKIALDKEIKTTKESNYSIKVNPPKGIVITDKTEQFILDGLSEFENSTYFNNPSMSLQMLAKKLKTNSKYLSEIIHIHKNKNFNNYINELRINYIIKEMTSDARYLNYKVSYLAEVCGFSSHSAFSAVFKSVTELTPKQFVSFLKKKNEKQ